MPLTPRFTWEQDAASIALAIALPGGALRNADIYGAFSSSLYPYRYFYTVKQLTLAL